MEDVRSNYRRELANLKLNSKPLINSLTMMAEDNIQAAPLVVQIIETQLDKVPREGKLPILYLIDSIVKNIKRDYVPLFTQNIVSTFTRVFLAVDDRTRTQMFKLRHTWNDIFPLNKLQAIDREIHRLDSGWPISVTASSNTIHLNPRFLSRQTPLSLAPSALGIPPSVTATTISTYESSPSSSPISLVEPLGDAAEAQMREQLLIKQKQLIELQQKKLELELLQTQTQLEAARKKKVQENKEQQLLRQADLARQQTLAAASIIANFAPGVSTQVPAVPTSQGNNNKPSSVLAASSAVGPNIMSTANSGISNDPRLNRSRFRPIPTPPPPPNISNLVKTERSTPSPHQSQAPTPSLLQPPVSVKVEKNVSPRKSESSGKSKSTERSPKPQKSVEQPRRKESPSPSPLAPAVSIKKEEDKSPDKSRHKSSSSRRKDSSRSSSGKGSPSRESSSSKSPKKSSKSRSHRERSKDKDSNGKPSTESKQTADSVDYEDEELGYSGITIKPAPARRDLPVVTKPSVHSPQSKSSHQSPARSPSKEPREHVKPEVSSSPRAPTNKLDRVNNNSRRNQSKSTKESSSSRREQDTPRASSSNNRNKDTVKHPRNDENVKDSYTKRKTLVLSRNYRKRDALQQEDDTSTDVDLRFEGLRDVDLRASPSSPKKSKSSASSAFIDNLFGREDVDLRQSQQSTSWSQVKKPKQGTGRGGGDENMDEDPARPPSAISPASSVGSTCDPLGRPLLYTRLPDDPDLRRRSLGSRSSSVDPLESFRIRYIEKPSRESGGNLSGADLKVAFIRVKEELESGKLTDNQYNLIIKQLIQINETSKIREVQQMDMMDITKPSVMQPMNANNLPNPWTTAGNPFNPQPSPVVNIVNPMFRPRGPSEFMQGGWSGGGPAQQQPFHVQLPQPRGPNPFVEASAAVLQQQPQPVPPNLIPIANPRELAQLELEFDSTIPLDKVPRVVRFYGKTAIVLVGDMGDEPRQISFQTEAAPRIVVINGEHINVRLGRSSRPAEFYLGRTKHTIEIGAPTRELYIDGIGYEVCFGGVPVQIQHNGEWVKLRLLGPPPSVEIGTVKRYDLVAGRTTIIIDGNPKPLFLDEKPQLVDFSGFSVILRFCDEFHGVVFNGRPFPTNFGGPPRPMLLPGTGRVVNIRFTAISRSTEINMVAHIRLRGHATLPPDDVLLSDGPGARGRTGRPGGRGEVSAPEPAPIRDTTREVDPFDVLANSLQPISSNNKSYETEPDGRGTAVTQQQPEPTINMQDLVNILLMAGQLKPPVKTPAEAAPEPTVPAVPVKEKEPTRVEPLHKPEAPVQKELPKVTFDDNLKMRRQFLIDSIYEGVQCAACGLRFGQDQTFRYTQHLDWHFRQNRREKAHYRKALSRKWYYDLSDWIQFEEIEDLEDRGVSIFETTADGNELGDGLVEDGKRVLNPDSYTVLAAGHEGETCPQCGEEFETFYDEDKEEWRLRDALLPDDQLASNLDEKNKLFHPICHQDYLAALLASADETTKMEEDPVEDDEVLILKEGKKEVVLMEIDVEDEADSGVSPLVHLAESPEVIEDSNSKDLSVSSPAIPAPPALESDSMMEQDRGPSYTILSPAPTTEAMHVDECIDLTLPGIASSPGTGVETSTHSNSIFSIVLDESNPGRPSTPDKVILYENMKFDFPKIKIEPVEWNDIEEDTVVKVVGADAGAPDASPLNITLDDDEEDEGTPTMESAGTGELEPKAADQPEPAQIDLTTDDDPVVEEDSVTTHIDGNLVFKGLSGQGSVAPPPAGRIRINITGLDIPPSNSGGSPVRKSPARKSPAHKSPEPIVLPEPEPGDKPETTPPDLEKLFNSAEMKALKPRLAGKKFTNCPVKKDKKSEESGLCSIC